MNSLYDVLSYPRLVVTSMRKNRGIYPPYLTVGGAMVGLLYVLDPVGIMVKASQMTGGGITQVIAEICGNTCTAFAVMILSYINSFAMKCRRREFGLLCVLGMEKKYPGLMLLWEVLIGLFASLMMGITVGALFSQAMFLLLLKMVGLPGKLMFVIPLQSVGKTCLIYVAAFALVLAYDLRSVFKANPMKLSRSSAQGERELKIRWLMTATGVVTPGFGYFLATSMGMTSDVLILFSPAALLVIVGTYCLFQAGSVAALKKLRRKKDFYYKPENSAAVSGMICRMKRNAAGLSGICILSVAVFVTMPTCASLYVGGGGILRNQYPRDIALFVGAGETVNPAGEAPGKVEMVAENLTRGRGCELESMMDFYQMSLNGGFKGGSFAASRYHSVGTRTVHVMTLEDHNRNSGGGEILAKGEMLYYALELPLAGKVEVYGETRRVAGVLKEFEVTQLAGFATPQDQVLLIVPESSDLHRLFRAYSEQLGEDARETISYHCPFDLAGSPEEKAGFETEFQDRIPGLNRGVMRDEIRTEFYQLYGSILLMGIFFMALLLMATVPIICYKQTTEGYDDRERLRTMEKVGVSAAEVKKMVTRRVVTVFFLPPGVAVIHVLAMFRTMCSLLGILSMHNVGPYAIFMACLALVFGVVYLAVYCVTARTYYRIVREQWKK